jgi:hypothetical protein
MSPDEGIGATFKFKCVNRNVLFDQHLWEQELWIIPSIIPVGSLKASHEKMNGCGSSIARRCSVDEFHFSLPLEVTK